MCECYDSGASNYCDIHQEVVDRYSKGSSKGSSTGLESMVSYASNSSGSSGSYPSQEGSY